MTEIVILDAVRTPLGRRNGWLRAQHPVRLGSELLCELLGRGNVAPEQVDHVLFGCVTQVSEQTWNIARNVVLDAGLPIEVPATTLDFQCGSSQQAVHLAAGMIASGQAEIVVAGGVESMTRVPMGSSLNDGQPFTRRIVKAFNPINQGRCSDEIATQWGISREEVDDIGYESHRRAARATEKGWFDAEIVPVEGLDDDDCPFLVTRDQGFRANPNREKMSQLDAIFTPDGGVTTAGNSSQISDGAAAVLVTSAATAKKLGLTPKARIVGMATVGSDPHLMLTGPITATPKVLAQAKMTLDDIDLFEVNEAFAAVVAMWQLETGVDLAKVNVHGSSIALGHPLGASGARLMATLLHALETHDKRFGLQTMCCGGGLGTGTILERIE